MKRHSESEIHLQALETLSKAAAGEGDEQKSAPDDGTVPTTAQVHLAIDLLKTSTRAGQGALFETSCARLRRADPTNFPVGRSTRSTWSQIIQAAAAVERDVDVELLKRCRAIGWSEVQTLVAVIKPCTWVPMAVTDRRTTREMLEKFV